MHGPNENNLINPYPAHTKEYSKWRYYNIPGLRDKMILMWRERRAKAAALRPPRVRQKLPPEELKRRKAARHKAYMKKRYAEDPEFRQEYKRKVAVARKKFYIKAKEFLNQKKASGCAVCGESCLPCLDFHHLDPSDKKFSVGSWSQYGVSTIEPIVEEVAKCIVLCSNCHRKLHAGIISLSITEEVCQK